MQCNTGHHAREVVACNMLHNATQHYHSPPPYLISFSVVGRSARSRPFRWVTRVSP